MSGGCGELKLVSSWRICPRSLFSLELSLFDPIPLNDVVVFPFETGWRCTAWEGDSLCSDTQLKCPWKKTLKSDWSFWILARLGG